VDGLATVTEESPLEIISKLTELNDTVQFMDDPQLDRALELTIKVLMEKGAVPQQKIPPLIVELQALATIFAMKATYYMTIGKGGSDEAAKKNIYYTAKDSITKLCDALKYLGRI
jgi:hypothetical protein